MLNQLFRLNMHRQYPISVSVIQTPEDLQTAHEIRRRVFVEEQCVAPEIEYDEFEAEATHVLAVLNGVPLGTARYRLTAEGIKLERFAVLREARQKGIGSALLGFILERVDHGNPIYLNSQVSAIAFYAKHGFQVVGDVFDEANIPHRKMVLRQI